MKNYMVSIPYMGKEEQQFVVKYILPSISCIVNQKMEQ